MGDPQQRQSTIFVLSTLGNMLGILLPCFFMSPMIREVVAVVDFVYLEVDIGTKPIGELFASRLD